MKNRAFTLVELLVVVLIIGILAAIAVPQYQLAVDKSRYSALMFLTKSIADAQAFAVQSGNYQPTFYDLDITMPGACTIDEKTLLCPDKNLYCELNNPTTKRIYPRCEDTSLKVSYYYVIEDGAIKDRICYAYSTDTSDRANRLCQAIVGHKISFNDKILTSSGGKEDSKGYYFKK